MARTRDERGTRYPGDDQIDADRERRHRRRKTREAEDDDAAKRERRERRRADEARRQAELDIEDLRARRESYYSRPETERSRNQDRMAQEIRVERPKEAPRTAPRELRRDGTRRTKRRDVADDRSDDYVYGRPKSRAVADEAPVRRSSTRKRSEEGGSSNRTAYTPRSGSGSASVRRVEVPKLNRYGSSQCRHLTHVDIQQEHIRTRAKQGSCDCKTDSATDEQYQATAFATSHCKNAFWTGHCAAKHWRHIREPLRKAASYTHNPGAQGSHHVSHRLI
jgi:hypothetical protein